MRTLLLGVDIGTSSCKAALFVGDDWYGTEKWKEYEREFDAAGIKIVYFPYTQGVSSSQIRRALETLRGDSLEDVK